MATVLNVIFEQSRLNSFRHFLHPTVILIFYVSAARDV
jgi:hypothetical protein